jgi:hypothetical protein
MSVTTLAWVDVFELTASLRTRAGLFSKEGDCRVLPIRGPRADADPEDDAAFVRFKVSTKWPELTNVLDQLRRLAGSPDFEFGRIYLEMLMPNGVIQWERETGDYAQRFQRVHLALRTNPGAFTFIGGASVNMQPGLVNLVDRRLPMSAINLGNAYRCHLICDFRKREEDHDA